MNRTKCYRWRLLPVLALVAASCSEIAAPAPDLAPQFGKPGSGGGVSGAAFTTINVAADGDGHCQNSAINCNIYDEKPYVWLNGGPAANHLGPDGEYFFAVLVPGGQPDPNDGGEKNLSDDFDAYTNRIFTVTAGEVSAYTGTHDFDSGTFENGGPKQQILVDGMPPFIRLFPYADTWNPGGVYIMAICSLERGYPVEPRDCKYDAFKVKKLTGRDQIIEFMLDGYKFNDYDHDGVMDADEPGLEGWTITLDGTDLFGNPISASATTDATGYWSFTSDTYTFTSKDVIVDIQLHVCEVQQDGWTQSGVVNESQGDGTTTTDGSCYDVTLPAFEGYYFVGGLNFGNHPQGEVSGGKYYDLNENGQHDAGEAWLSGWTITYDGSSVVTGADGMFGPLTLDPGSYAFAEVQGGNGWTQTGNTVAQYSVTGDATVSLAGFAYTVGIGRDAPSNVAGLYFGNVCKKPVTGGGVTPGWWHNKNGNELITEDDLAALRALNLVNEDGSAFDPTTREQVAGWILSDAGQNMAWKLSSFVAAMTLNLRHGFADGSVLMSADGATWMTAAEWVDYGNELLGLYPLTPSGAPGRDEQTVVKSLLDQAVNGYAFVQPAPGDACNG